MLSNLQVHELKVLSLGMKNVTKLLHLLNILIVYQPNYRHVYLSI